MIKLESKEVMEEHMATCDKMYCGECQKYSRDLRLYDDLLLLSDVLTEVHRGYELQLDGVSFLFNKYLNKWCKRGADHKWYRCKNGVEQVGELIQRYSGESFE